MRIGRIVMSLVCLSLLLLGSRTLVVGPEEAAPAPVRAEAPPGMKWVERLLPVREESARTAQAPQLRLREGALPAAVPVQDCLPVADRNGHPLARAVYRRTVWQAFPPERLPG